MLLTQAQKSSLGLAHLVLDTKVKDLFLCGHPELVMAHDRHRHETHVAWALGHWLQDRITVPAVTVPQP